MNFERRFHPGVQKSSGITLSDLDKGGPERPEIAEAAMPHELFLKGAKEALDASVSLRRRTKAGDGEVIAQVHAARVMPPLPRTVP
jgi:hypothetical protein